MLRLHVRTLGAHFSEGARLLWVEVLHRGLDLTALAKSVRRTKGAVSRWLRGDRKPDQESRGVIHERFGVDPKAWDRKSKRAFAIPTMAPTTVSTTSTARNGSA